MNADPNEDPNADPNEDADAADGSVAEGSRSASRDEDEDEAEATTVRGMASPGLARVFVARLGRICPRVRREEALGITRFACGFPRGWIRGITSCSRVRSRARVDDDGVGRRARDDAGRGDALGHAVLPLASARETLAEELASARERDAEVHLPR